MVIPVYLTLFLLSACSGVLPRGPASVTEGEGILREMVREKSSVRLFPPSKHDQIISNYFYLELKDKSDNGVEALPQDIQVKDVSTALPFRMERISIGRYYVIVESTFALKTPQIDVLYRGKPLAEKFKLVTNVPDPKRTELQVVHRESHSIRLRLTLKDSQGKLIDIPSDPEIVFRGEAKLEEMNRTLKGQWEFSVSYPEENQIIYLSLRVHGTYLEDIFRFQHVEK